MAEVKHPAKFSRSVIDALWLEIAAEISRQFGGPRDSWPHRQLRVLDPFAGVGGVHKLESIWNQTFGVELEFEWAKERPGTLVGDALRLPFAASTFDIVATSPCYGNRMADTYDGKGVCRKCLGDGDLMEAAGGLTVCDRCGGSGEDQSRRHTYRLDLGRMPTAGSSCTMQWGKAYRMFHVAAWRESRRVLAANGLMLLNVSDHIRGKRVVRVSDWHRALLKALGFEVVRVVEVPTKRMREGQNYQARVGAERLIVARKLAA